jgi:hypothetical protein
MVGEIERKGEVEGCHDIVMPSDFFVFREDQKGTAAEDAEKNIVILGVEEDKAPKGKTEHEIDPQPNAHDVASMYKDLYGERK